MRVRLPPEPPVSRRGRAANAARCKRAVLADFEGASPSVSTMPAKRRKRRIPLVSGRAERKSPCRIHFLRTWRNSIRAGPRCRWAQAHEGATPSVRTSFSAGGGMHTRESQKLVGASPCRCESCPADQFSAVARSDSTKAPFNFQSVRSGLLRFYARGCRFKSDPSLHLRGGSSMVEHVIVLWSAFSWFPFLGSEG